MTQGYLTGKRLRTPDLELRRRTTSMQWSKRPWCSNFDQQISFLDRCSPVRKLWICCKFQSLVSNFFRTVMCRSNFLLIVIPRRVEDKTRNWRIVSVVCDK